MSKPKPKTSLYTIKPGQSGWARIWITDDGSFTTISDYGNYGYWWSHPGCEFRKFLCDCDKHYLTTKLNGGRSEYDEEGTLKNVKEHIARLREEGDWTEAQAKQELHLLRQYSDISDLYSMHMWTTETKLEISTGELIRHRMPIHVEMFVERVWPLFVEQLKQELLIESQQSAPAAP